MAGKTYPLCSKTTGVAPKQFIKTPLISKEDASAFDEAGFEEVYDNEDYGLESEQGEDLFADNDEAEAESDNDADEDDIKEKDEDDEKEDEEEEKEGEENEEDDEIEEDEEDDDGDNEEEEGEK